MLLGSNSQSHTIETYSGLKTIQPPFSVFYIAASLTCLGSLPSMELNPSPNPLSLNSCWVLWGIAYPNVQVVGLMPSRKRA